MMISSGVDTKASTKLLKTNKNHTDCGFSLLAVMFLVLTAVSSLVYR